MITVCRWHSFQSVVSTGRHDACWPLTGAQVQTPHRAFITARDRGASPPKVIEAQGAVGCSDRLARSGRNGWNPYNGRKAAQAAPTHRLRLRAKRSGEADD